METERERWLRVAPERTSTALAALDALGETAGREYESTPNEVGQILDAMFDAVHDLKRKFEQGKARRSETTFAFGRPKRPREERA